MRDILSSSHIQLGEDDNGEELHCVEIAHFAGGMFGVSFYTHQNAGESSEWEEFTSEEYVALIRSLITFAKAQGILMEGATFS